MGFNALFGGDLHMRKWMIVLLIAALAMSLWAVVLAEEAEIWANVSAEEVEAAVGVGLGVPDGAESVCYSLLADENLAEVSFTWYDLEYVARVKPAEAFEDLSGLDIDSWDQTVEFDVSGNAIHANYLYDEDEQDKIDDYNARLQAWKDGGRKGDEPKLKAYLFAQLIHEDCILLRCTSQQGPDFHGTG